MKYIQITKSDAEEFVRTLRSVRLKLRLREEYEINRVTKIIDKLEHELKFLKD